MLKKIKPLLFNKIWGFEKWIYSPYKGKETKFENSNEIVPNGPIVKIIKTKEPLSIQVHPDDELAKTLEGKENGKHESWYILESNNSELILGMKKYDKNFIKENINKDIFLNNLNKVIANKNHFYDIPAGLIHGLGANITVLEVQQCSDITYRYFDYNRLINGKKRDLHLDKALKSQKKLNYKINKISNFPLSYKNKVATQTFYYQKTFVPKNCLVVDLNNYDSYWTEKKVEVNLNNFVVINW